MVVVSNSLQMIVTAGTLEESKAALALARSHPALYSTVGVHPTRCSEFFANGVDPQDHVAALAAVLEEGKQAGKVKSATREGDMVYRYIMWWTPTW